MNSLLEQNKKPFSIEEIELKELLQSLRAGKNIILLCGAIFFVLTCIYVFLQSPVYEPSVLLQVNNQNNNTNNLFAGSVLGSVANNAGFGMQTQASVAQVQMTLMETDYILQPVIDSLALNVEVRPKHFPIVGGYIARHYHGNDPAPARLGLNSYAWGGETLDVASFNVPVDNFKEKFTLRVLDQHNYALFHGRKLILKGMVGSAAASDDGKYSLVIRQMHARPHTEFYLYRYSNVNTLADLKKMLTITELAPTTGTGYNTSGDTGIIQISTKSSAPLNAVAILNALANLATQDSSVQNNKQNAKMLDFIHQEIPVAQQNLTEAEARLNAYQTKSGLIDLTNQSKSLLQDMNYIDGQLIQAELTKAQLLQVYTPANPMVQNTQSGIAALTQQKTKLAALIANLPARYQTAVDLMRDVRVYSMLYTQLFAKAQQMRITSAGLASDLTVLSLATVPDQALPSRAFTTVLVSTLLGLILGCLIVLVRYFMSGINDPYFVERELGIRTIGIIPYSETQAKNKKLFDQGKAPTLPILSRIDSHDPAIESLRGLRTSLSLLLAKKTGKCVTVSGIIPQIGKSFISINLAVVLAEAGKKVLLIDADIRKGYLHQYFNRAIAPGLSELLNGVSRLDNIVHKTDFANLDFIACGLHNENPGDLLLKPEFAQILQSLEQYYDLIILDTPPILAVSDASLIAKHCAVNLIVVAAGKLQKHEITTAVKQFYSHGVQLDGGIFNFTSKNTQTASKFNYHHYYTRYYRKK